MFLSRRKVHFAILVTILNMLISCGDNSVIDGSAKTESKQERESRNYRDEILRNEIIALREEILKKQEERRAEILKKHNEKKKFSEDLKTDALKYNLNLDLIEEAALNYLLEKEKDMDSDEREYFASDITNAILLIHMRSNRVKDACYSSKLELIQSACIPEYYMIVKSIR